MNMLFLLISFLSSEQGRLGPTSSGQISISITVNRTINPIVGSSELKFISNHQFYTNSITNNNVKTVIVSPI